MTHYIKNRVHYLRQRLRERDGDLCWLCGKPMVFDSRKNKPDAATIDHIVPQSHGGQTTMANLRLAHKLCNNRRGSPAPEASARRHP
jgi:5-methylcytosine-specific restriction endonuclease McrA